MDWLAKLIEFIRDLFPRKFFLSPDEGGVRITLGSRVQALKSGWYYFWPVLQECNGIKISPQLVDLRPQSTLTSDLVDIVVSGGLKYKVTDVRKTLLEVHDYDKSIQTAALGIICEYVNKRRFEEINNFSDLRDAILAGIREEASGMGLKIMKVYITDIGRTKNLRVLGSNQTIIAEDEDE